MKTTTLKLSLILALGYALSGCIVHRTVYVTAPPVEPIQMQTEVYEPQPTVIVEQPADYYRAPDYVFSYYYCPEQNFYYNSESYSFWWYEGNTWHSGYELPNSYNIHTNTTYVTVEERDNNPTKYNHNHVNYYKQGRYNNKIHKVGDDDKLRFERNSASKNYYYKRDANKTYRNNTGVKKDAPPAGVGNKNNDHNGYNGGNQQNNNKHGNQKQGNQQNKQGNYKQGDHNQGKSNQPKPTELKKPLGNDNNKTNNGRYNQGNPNVDIKTDKGASPTSREKEKTNKQINQSPNQQQEKSRTFTNANPNSEVKQSKDRPVKERQTESKQGKGNQDAPAVREQKVQTQPATPPRDNSQKPKNRSGRQ